MKNTVYLYMWKESNRFALFPYAIENPPKSLFSVGNFNNVFDLFNVVRLWSKKYPNKSISTESYKNILLIDYSFESAVNDFNRFFPNTQLTLGL